MTAPIVMMRAVVLCKKGDRHKYLQRSHDI